METVTTYALIKGGIDKGGKAEKPRPDSGRRINGVLTHSIVAGAHWPLEGEGCASVYGALRAV